MTPRYEPPSYRLETERVDSIPVVLETLKRMGVQLIIDACFSPHGNHQGLSVGWLASVFLTYILTEADHKMVSVQDWEAKHHHTLERLSGQSISDTDFTDDRLADVLRYLSDDDLWRRVEQGLSRQTIRAYRLATSGPVRLDATVGGVNHNEKKHTLFRSGRTKKGGYEVQFKVMLAVLDPLGLALAADVVAGNVADDPLYGPLYQRIRQTLETSGLLYIGDSKMGALDTRALIESGADYYLMPLAMVGHTPALLDELLSLLQARTVELTPIYFPQDLPAEPNEAPDPELTIAEGFEVVREQQATLEDGRLVTWSERLLVIRSRAFAQAKQAAFEQQLAQAEADILALTPPPGRGQRQFDEPVALQQAIDNILSRSRLTDYFDIHLEQHRTTRHVRAYKNKPARIEQKIRYQVHLSRRVRAIEQAQFRLGWRMYATNAAVKHLTLTAAVLAYRDQYLAERPFARLKGSLLQLLPLYVHRDDHAKGLIHLLTIGLRALTITEFVARRALAETNQTLCGLYDGNPRRSTARPSAELLLAAFDDITLSLRLNQAGEIVEQYLTPLNPLQSRILELLELSSDIYASLTGFPLSLPIFQDELRPDYVGRS